MISCGVFKHCQVVRIFQNAVIAHSIDGGKCLISQFVELVKNTVAVSLLSESLVCFLLSKDSRFTILFY